MGGIGGLELVVVGRDGGEWRLLERGRRPKRS